MVEATGHVLHSFHYGMDYSFICIESVEQLLGSNPDVIYRGGRIMHSILVFHSLDCIELNCIQLNGRNL